tara:strand:- start:240 stop:479 length:240 start_codon:yes stop_codon:yes gene_type:complete
MRKYNFSLSNLVERCNEVELGRKILIVPNNSGDHNILMKSLDEQDIKYVSYLLNQQESPPPQVDDIHYIIDFNEINLVQ